MNSKKKVLLVDDEKAIRKVIGIKLKISGYEVIHAAGGQEALDLAKSDCPDIMLLDIVMQELDGLEVLKKLRMFSKIPVIAFSARPEKAQQALSLGADDFIAKPLDVYELVQRIEGLLCGG